MTTPIQTASGIYSAQSATLQFSFANPTTMGNTIIVVVGAYSRAISPMNSCAVLISSVADNFICAGFGNHVNGFISYWVDTGCAGGQKTITIDDPALNYMEAYAYEMPGKWYPDQRSYDGGSSTSAISGYTLPIPTGYSELVIGMTFAVGGGETLTGPGGIWTNLTQLTGAGYCSISGYGTALTGTTPQYTTTLSGSASWGTTIMGFATTYPAKTAPIGVYRGNGGCQNPNGSTLSSPTSAQAIGNIVAYETFINRQVNYVIDYLEDSPTSWTQFETGILGAQTLKSYAVDIWSGVLGTRKLMLSIPACCGHTAGSGASTWAGEAAGTNDAHWTALGNYLIAQGFGYATLRIGREFNGNWYWWSPTNTGDSSANYIAGYQHIVTLLRGLTDAHFKFMWNPILGAFSTGGAEVQTYYPGNSYVDIIGLDCYDWGDYSTLTVKPWTRSLVAQATNWNNMQTMTDGFNSWVEFVNPGGTAAGVPLAFPEWGDQLWLSGGNYIGGGDDYFFINQMEPYIASSICGAMWEDGTAGVFEADNVGPKLTPVPLSRAAFLTEYCSGALGFPLYVPSPTVLPGNILTVADSDFETGSTTWANYSGSNAPAIASTSAFVGFNSLTWTASGTSDSFIATGYYPCIGNSGYDVSGYIVTTQASHDTYVGLNFFDNTHTFISTVWGQDNPSTTGTWQPFVANITSPSNAAYMEVTVWVGTNVTSGEPFAIDLMYVTNTVASVWVDWSNPAFKSGSAAGSDFMDMTPWVRLDQYVNMTHGRQDAISEVQAGQASFYVQNDIGWFTPQKAVSPYYPGIGLGARCQINCTNQIGVFYTRFDGALSEITYAVDVTGGTNLAMFSCSDVLAYLNRQDPISTWTKQTILGDGPWMHWTLNDSGLAGLCSESSGNNGPPLRAINYNATGTISWASTSAGIETLANAASPANTNGAEYWNAGSIIPTSQTRGLDAGVVGPTSTPLGNISLTPVIASQGGQNYFWGTSGWQANAALYIGGVPTPLTTSTQNYSIEAYFCMSSQITTTAKGGNYGPFTIFSLGSSRSAPCLVAGIYLSGSNFLVGLDNYAFAPGMAVGSFTSVPSPTTSVTASIAANPNVVHHLVVEITAGAPPTAVFYLDNGPPTASINLPYGQAYDTICVGGCVGGQGNFAGDLSCVSIYQYLLSQSQIANHCMMGQYGMWEQTTDNCIAQLAQFAGIPQFWNNLSAQNYGLSLTDYYDVSGATPLSSMQVYEQTERGLLYVNMQGQLSFHTRDWRMGYGAPDITLPSSTYNTDLGYELIDTYLLNEASTATTVFTTGVDWASTSSQQEYGVYANGTQSAPIQLPLITWGRGWTSEGVTSQTFWPDPNLNDNSAWQVNTRNSPRLIPGQLTIDLLTMEPSSFIGGLTIDDLYNLDIDNMVTIGGLPTGNFPDQVFADDYFIEGVNEIVGLTQRQITFYTSPAAIQRAWKPGDTTYGQLGLTSRLGISAPDTSAPPPLSKQVGHDGGPPYWPPNFQNVPAATGMGYKNITTQNPAIAVSANSNQGDCILVQVISPVAATITVADTQNTGNYTAIGNVTNTGFYQYLFAYFNSAPLTNGGDTITITTDASRNYTTTSYRIMGISGMDIAFNTATGTGTAVAITPTGPLNAYNDLQFVIVTNANTEQLNIPAGWTQFGYNYSGIYQNQMLTRQATTVTPDAYSATLNGASTPWAAIAVSFTVNNYYMNNPAQNNHAFVGANDIRGMRDTLSLALNPPMLCVGQISSPAQSVASGNTGVNANSRTLWNDVFIDTAGGMGIIPGWNNWYCVQVPGFYEISAQNQWPAQSSGAAGIRTGWIIVAQGAAAGVAANAGVSPYATTYVCPVGEQIYPNDVSKQPISCPVTRLYLGVGDMVTMGNMHTQGSALNMGNGIAHGSWFSMRWVAYGNAQDQYPTLGQPGGSTINQPPTQKHQYTSHWYPTATYSYYWTYSKRNTNSDMIQGSYSGAPGPQYSVALWPYASIQSALSGATINSISLRMTNTHSWYYSGCSLQIGISPSSSFGSTYNPYSGNILDVQEFFFKENQTLTMTLGNWFASELQSGGAKAFIFGNGNSSLNYYGYWTGGTSGNAPYLSITYTK